MTATRVAARHRAIPGPIGTDRWPRVLLWVGVAVFAVSMGAYLGYLVMVPIHGWMAPVDIKVYRTGGLIALHVPPAYNPHRASPLYDWPGLYGQLKFTYTPFAALVFTVLPLFPFYALLKLSVLTDIGSVLLTIWVTLTALGHRNRIAKAGATLLITAVVFWSEPVARVLYLGQVELFLMALVVWDMCLDDRHKWKGIGVGIAAGIKLVPLVFIPYLLLTRRYRQAAVATGTFVASVLLGFIFMPPDSINYWFSGAFAQGSRTGFIGWSGNQSLEAMITRLAGSIAAGKIPWLLACVVVGGVGLLAAAVMDRAGHRALAVISVGVLGNLLSPISWDHHWVWVVPVVTVLASYTWRARGSARWALAATTLATLVAFGGWPGSLFGQPHDLGSFSLGLIFLAPSDSGFYFQYLGDRPWYAEYHWTGIDLLAGNLFVLTGLALITLMAIMAFRVWRRTGTRIPAI